MGTKLIIVEGLPGSGKSTAAQMVHEILKDKGIKSELFCEGNYNHPVDYDGVAYFNNEDFDTLQETYSTNRNVLDKIKIKYCNGYLIPYREAIEEQKLLLDDELLNDITKNDIYKLPMETHTNLILNRWDDFVNNYNFEDKVVIIECCFIQNPVTVSMIRSNCPKDVTMSYIQSLADKIVPLEPVLIYVGQNNIKVSFSRVVNGRDKEWFEEFKYYYTSQGYGADNNLKELTGVLKILEARSSLERDIYDSLKLVKYRIDNSSFDLKLLKEKLNVVIEASL